MCYTVNRGPFRRECCRQEMEKNQKGAAAGDGTAERFQRCQVLN